MSIERKEAELKTIDKRSDLAFYAGLAGFAAIIASSNLVVPGVDSPNFLMLASVVGECAAITDFVCLEIGRDILQREILKENSERLQKRLDDLGSKLTREH